MAVRTSIQRCYSQWGTGEFHITYDDVDWRVSVLRVINNSLTATLRLVIYTSTPDHLPVLTYDGFPGEDRTQNIPTGQDYYLDQYNVGLGFLDPRGTILAA